MRILEATIAVLIVSGVLMVVYSRQVDRGVDPVDYFRSLQGQICVSVLKVRQNKIYPIIRADTQVCPCDKLLCC